MTINKNFGHLKGQLLFSRHSPQNDGPSALSPFREKAPGSRDSIWYQTVA